MTQRSSHERAGQLFLAAAALPKGERDAFLHDACLGDAALEAGVRALLAHDDAALLGEPLLGRSVATLFDEARATLDSLPARIGPYTVLERLGAGATGVVYRARQDHPRREIAVKLLRPSLADERLARRLAFEAEILARLDHPGIARVLDAGWHAGQDGARPYLAMELVRGLPLTTWVSQQAPSLATRVALLVAVCDAVSHAHGRGVIHRDLKPENILVTEDGRPKVLDFGIARVFGDDRRGTTLVTGAGQLVGTLAFTSPEQVGPHPETVDTRADVYALGVLAYHVLGGRAPYELDELPLHEATRVVRQHEPALLGRIDPSLRGGLETVVAHALEKQRERRYASAADLAGDLGRALAGEPLLARPEPAWRQLGRLARQHPVGVMLLALLVVAPLAAMSLERAASRELKRQTQEQRATHAALADLLADTGLGRWPGEESVADLMRRADELVPYHARGDVGLEGSLWIVVGRSLAHADVFPNQREQARAALERGVALQRRAYGADDPRALSALLDLAELAARHGDVAEAAGLLDRFERDAHAHFEDHDERVLAARSLRGSLAIAAGHVDEATPLLERVVAVARGRLGDDSDLALSAAGRLATACGRPDPAQALLSALADRLEAGAADERTVRGVVSLLDALHGDAPPTDACLALERRAIEAYATVRGDEDPTTCLYWNHHALLLLRAGFPDEAECLLRRSLARLCRAPGAGTKQALECERQLADLFAATGRPHAAEAGYRAVLADMPGPLASIDLYTRASTGLARLEQADGRDGDAEARLVTAAAWRDHLFGGNRASLAPVDDALAALYAARRQADLAAALRAPSPARGSGRR